MPMGQTLPSHDPRAGQRACARLRGWVVLGQVEAAPGGRWFAGRGAARPRCRQSPVVNGGFSLVEVLIAVIVLAVGLLGMAGLQISALRANESARFRTIATQASLDLIDRLRADPYAVLGSRGLRATLAADACADPSIAGWRKDFCAFGLPAPVKSSDVLAIDCSNSDGATGCGEGNCEITVRWDDSRADRSASAHDAVFRVCTRLPAL